MMRNLKTVCIFLIAFFLAGQLIAQPAKKDARFERIQSETLKSQKLTSVLQQALVGFSDQKYQKLKPLVFERSIPEIQKAVQTGKLSYQDLTLFYLYRISKFETQHQTSLHAVIALNPEVLKEAKEKDLQLKNRKAKHGIFGMPVLLKDNIGAENMKTTAGALALQNNETDDAFVVKRLKEKGALILGKVNLSEWAYYFCKGCPSGYSGVGGYTLNPYGPGIFDTGGSSSGTAVAVAANYAVAAIGTETAGSILSPSSQNSVVGLKPTLGLLSRSGIIPLSSSFDTPGPVTKSVVDNAIVLSAMLGKDKNDATSFDGRVIDDQPQSLSKTSLAGKRFGLIKAYLENPLYAQAVEKLKKAGVVMVEIEPKLTGVSGKDFMVILNQDMKSDLAQYLNTYGGKQVGIRSVKDVVAFNLQDMELRAPYGQALLEGVLGDSTSLSTLKETKNRLETSCKHFFEEIFNKNKLEVILSVNNYNAFEAAAAKYPAICVPMGYTPKGEPMSLTFIARPFGENKLIQLGMAYEKIAPARKVPELYKD
jgi:amidase